MKLAIIVATGSKADALAGQILSGSQGNEIYELLGRHGIGMESVKVFSILPFPQYAAPRNDAEGMEMWFDTFAWSGDAGVDLPHAPGSIGALCELSGHTAAGLEPANNQGQRGSGGEVTEAPPACDLEGASGHLMPNAGVATRPLKPSSILQGGIESLRQALYNYSPTMILALGSAALHLMRHGHAPPPRKAGAYAWIDSIGEWRGSLFESDWAGWPVDLTHGAIQRTGFHCVKTLAAYHPTWIQRDGGLSAYMRADMARCAKELRAGPALTPPVRKVHVASTVKEAIQWITSYHIMGAAEGKLISNDSEGVSQISMFGFAVTPHEAHVIPFIDHAGRSLWTEDEEVEIWEALESYLCDPKVRKVWQYWPSDAFLLVWYYGIVTEGLSHDVMIAAWEAQPELEKGLNIVSSLYVAGHCCWKTKENYANRLDYVCGMDAMVTLECHNVLDRILKGGQRDHYAFNIAQLPSTLYQMLEGLPFDRKQARIDLKELEHSIHETQHEINRAAYEAAEETCKTEEALSEQHRVSDPDGQAPSLSHTSARAARLAAWFGAIDGAGNRLSEREQQPRRLHGDPGSEAFLALAIAAFGEKRHRETVKVTEERWQPMRWSVKSQRWVKAGRLLTEQNVPGCPCLALGNDVPSPADEPEMLWLKPVPRVVERSVEVPVDTWETLERFCKESCEGALKRVRKLVKELERTYGSDGQVGITEKMRRHPNNGEDAQYAGVIEKTSSNSLLGELSILLKLAINSGSTQQGGDSQWLLHECWQLPKKLKKIVHVVEEGEEEGDPALTTDASMLLSLWARCQQPEWGEWRKHSKLRHDELRDWLKASAARIELVLKMRKLVKERAYLNVATDNDGHVRYGLNLVQAATGRFAAYGSPTGKSRLNPQTVGKKHRHLYTYPKVSMADYEEAHWQPTGGVVPGES